MICYNQQYLIVLLHDSVPHIFKYIMPCMSTDYGHKPRTKWESVKHDWCSSIWSISLRIMIHYCTKDVSRGEESFLSTLKLYMELLYLCTMIIILVLISDRQTDRQTRYSSYLWHIVLAAWVSRMEAFFFFFTASSFPIRAVSQPIKNLRYIYMKNCTHAWVQGTWELVDIYLNALNFLKVSLGLESLYHVYWRTFLMLIICHHSTLSLLKLQSNARILIITSSFIYQNMIFKF